MFAVVTVTDRLGLMLHGPAPGDFECVYAIIGGCENPQMRQCGGGPDYTAALGRLAAPSRLFKTPSQARRVLFEQE